MAKSDETSGRRLAIGANCTEQNIAHGDHANCSLGWFLEQKHRYQPRHGNNFEIYYSGEEIFTALSESILNAKTSVDLILWGLDPAMPLIREAAEYSPKLLSLVNRTNTNKPIYSGWREEDAYGEIILKALRENKNLKIRIVIWYNPVSHFVAQNIVGINAVRSVDSSSADRLSIGFEPEAFTEKDLGKLLLSKRTPEASAYSLKWFQTVRWEDFPERDRLAITFRSIADIGLVNQGLHGESIASLLQKWSNLQRDMDAFTEEVRKLTESIAEEIRKTQTYSYYQEAKKELSGIVVWTYRELRSTATEIRKKIEANEYGAMLIDGIKDFNNMTQEAYTYVEAKLADYLSSKGAIDLIALLRNRKMDILTQLADILEVAEEDVHYLSNLAERGSLSVATDHQKVALIDYENKATRHAYVMGHNSTTSYWSRFPFEHRDVKNEMSGTPYHDFSMKVTGQLLIDLNHNFCEAWGKNRTSALSSLTHEGIPFPEDNKNARPDIAPSKLESEFAGDGELAEERKQYEEEILQQFSQGGVSGQIVRTRPDQRFEDGFQEKEVKDAYLQATRHANNYIFIVNQYCQYPELIRHIKYWRAERKKGNLQGTLYILVGTCKPELDGQVFVAQQMANELGVGAQFTTGEDELYNKDRVGEDVPTGEKMQAAMQQMTDRLGVDAQIPDLTNLKEVQASAQQLADKLGVDVQIANADPKELQAALQKIASQLSTDAQHTYDTKAKELQATVQQMADKLGMNIQVPNATTKELQAAVQQMATRLGFNEQSSNASAKPTAESSNGDSDRRKKTFRGAWADAADHVTAKDLEELDIKVLFFMFYTQIPEYELPQPDQTATVPTRDAVRPIYNILGEQVGEITPDINAKELIAEYQAKGVDLYSSSGEKLSANMNNLEAKLMEIDFISAQVANENSAYNNALGKAAEAYGSARDKGAEIYDTASNKAAPYMDEAINLGTKASDMVAPYVNEGIDIVTNPGERIIIPAGQKAADGVEWLAQKARDYAAKTASNYPVEGKLETPEEMREGMKEASGIENLEIKRPWRPEEVKPGDKLPPDRIAQQPYVHAKLMLLDDMFFTMGSSNLNIRSMAIDSELNLISDDYNTAQNMRFKLLNDYSGEPFDEDEYPNRTYDYSQGAAPQVMQPDLKQMHITLTDIAKLNSDKVTRGERIQGYIARFEDSRTALGMRQS